MMTLVLMLIMPLLMAIMMAALGLACHYGSYFDDEEDGCVYDLEVLKFRHDITSTKNSMTENLFKTFCN